MYPESKPFNQAGRRFHMITRTRGFLPHTEVPQGTYFLTFRLFDSLPRFVLSQYQQELEWKKRVQPNHSQILVNVYQAKIQKYLDSSYGNCWLRDPRIASFILDAFRKHQDDWYILHACTIMPNHVYALFSLKSANDLSEVIRNLKGSTAFYANKILQRSGIFWQREYFERIVKSKRQFEFVIRYTYRNPVKAGLCDDPFKWPWTRSSQEIECLLKRFFV
jgi:REP element-mobilizing transposase RayT